MPFLSQQGIFRAAIQTGPAALSIKTSVRSPYGDEITGDGLVYAYRAGVINQADNRALRAAYRLGVPLVYFFATRPGRYEVFYPCYVVDDDPGGRCVLVSIGKMVGPIDEPEPILPVDPIERSYANRIVRIRMHQGRFRGLVLPAYREQCAVCRLKESRLLDAAHIVGDAEDGGAPEIANGLSLCAIHHRAFDNDLVGIAPDYSVHVARKLLEDDDGPMLDVLKTSQGSTIQVPRSTALRPDPERLAARFDRFQSAA